MNDNKIEPSIYRYILQHTGKDQIFLLLLTLVTMPIVYFSLEVPKIIINGAISGEGVPDSVFGFEIDQIGYLLFLCGLFLFLVLLSGGLKYVTNVYRGIVGERMLRRVRFDLYSRILRFPSKRFKQVSQGELLPMVTAETEPLGGFIGDSFALPAFQGGLLFTYLFFIFNQDVILGLAAVALYPPQLYLIPKLQKKVNELAKQRVQAVRSLSDKVGESISGISDIHLNDTSHYEKAHVSHRLGKIYGIRFDIYKKKFFIKFLNNFLGQLTPFFFYAIGGYYVIKGELTLGALVAVLAAYKDLASPWKELLKFYQITEDIRVKYRQIIDQFQLKDMLPSALQNDQTHDIKFDQGTLSGSSITYSEDEYVNSLDSVSFKFAPKKHIGIIGRGGSGRGDLAQLIVRLIHPDNGKINIGDQDIAELSESILGRTISYVDPQSYVFTGTINENLVYSLKNRQIDEASTDEVSKEKANQKFNSLKSGNPTDDAYGNWVDTERVKTSENSSFQQHIQKVLESTELVQDVYELGLRSSVAATNHPNLVSEIQSARKALRDVIHLDEYKGLIEFLREDRYNLNLSVAENLFFGMPLESDPEYRNLRSHPVVKKVLDDTGLTEILFRTGLETAKVLSEIFADVADGSPLFERFSFVTAEQLPALGKLSKLTKDVSIEEVEDKDVELLHDLSLKLMVARHRLGLITDDIQATITKAHLQIKTDLGVENGMIEFFEEDNVADHLSIQDNVLFGRIAYGQANAKEKVGKLVDNVIKDSGLRPSIIEAGLEYQVGVGGAKLTNIQRQKLTLARALVKSPEIFVINDATALLDKKSAERIKNEILKSMEGKSVIWVLSNIEMTEGFDQLVVMDKGNIVAEGSVAEIIANTKLIASLEQ